MPRMNGYDLLKKLRVDYDNPVMIISAKVQLEDRIIGSELGADDYITKPFGPLEVTARIKAHLRRYSKSSLTFQNKDSNVIVHKDLKLDLDRCQLHVGEKTVYSIQIGEMLGISEKTVEGICIVLACAVLTFASRFFYNKVSAAVNEEAKHQF